MNNLSIKTKVIAAFGLTLPVVLTIGPLAAEPPAAVNEVTAGTRARHLPATEALGELFLPTTRHRRSEVTSIAATPRDGLRQLLALGDERRLVE